jgi:hypothetical protein
MGLTATISVLLVQLVLLGLCYWRARQPANPMKPRLLPYRFLILLLVVTSLATLAHVFALVTGIPVEPRRRRGL